MRPIQEATGSMSIENILSEEATYQAERMQGPSPALEAQLREIERSKTDIEAQLDAAKRAHKRLLDYRPRIGVDFQCPRCWIQKEVKSALSPVGGATRDDILRCHTCGLDIYIPEQ